MASRGPTAWSRIRELMKDGQPRTIRRIHYLTEVSLNTIRKAVAEGHLVKVGEEPRPVPHARCGQAIVRIASLHEEDGRFCW